MTDSEIRQIRDALADLKTELGEVRGELKELRSEVAEASKFKDGFDNVTKTLAWLLGIAVMVSTIYAAVIR